MPSGAPRDRRGMSRARRLEQALAFRSKSGVAAGSSAGRAARVTSAAGSAVRAGAVTAGVVSRSAGRRAGRRLTGVASGDRAAISTSDSAASSTGRGSGRKAASSAAAALRRCAAARASIRAGRGIASTGGRPAITVGKGSGRGGIGSASSNPAPGVAGGREASKARTGTASTPASSPAIAGSSGSPTGRVPRLACGISTRAGTLISPSPARRSAGAIRVTVTVSSAAQTQADARQRRDDGGRRFQKVGSCVNGPLFQQVKISVPHGERDTLKRLSKQEHPTPRRVRPGNVAEICRFSVGASGFLRQLRCWSS